MNYKLFFVMFVTNNMAKRRDRNSYTHPAIMFMIYTGSKYVGNYTDICDRYLVNAPCVYNDGEGNYKIWYKIFVQPDEKWFDSLARMLNNYKELELQVKRIYHQF